MDIRTNSKTNLAAYASRAGLVFSFSALLFVFIDFTDSHVALLKIAFWFSCMTFVIWLAVMVLFLCGRATRRTVMYALLALICAMPVLAFGVSAKVCIWTRNMKERSNTTRCNMRMLRAALLGYAATHDNMLPDANDWGTLLMKFDSSLSESDFKHPRFPEISITYNSKLSEMELSEIPDDVVLFFEAEGGLNLSGGQQLINANRMWGGVNIMLLSGKFEDYRPEHKGVRIDYNIFAPVRWGP